MGEPDGIGPEIIRKSLAACAPTNPTVIIGDRRRYDGVEFLQEIRCIDDMPDDPAGVCFFHIDSGEAHATASFRFVEAAISWALAGKVCAIVTGPVSKERWLSSGVPYGGHTELLAKTAAVKNHCMFFWSDDLRVALYTIHLPLKEIFPFLKIEKITVFIRFVISELSRLFCREFTVLIPGINPHAGESGYLGREEQDIIEPAIRELQGEMDIRGPYPPDVVFIKAREIKNSVVIAWYHDQGLIPFKLLNIHRGVNMTLGLPYIRTSPDHGTAFDIAGKDLANPSSMQEAIKLAESLIRLKSS